MQTYYVIPAGSTLTAPIFARATALGAQLMVGDGTGAVTTFPSVVVTSSAVAAAVLADNTGQATLAAVQAAQAAATAAETTWNANDASLQSKAMAAVASNETFLAIASPTLAQAVAQLQTLTRIVNALILLSVQEFGNTTGT
jgi:hypothetical protein